ncbi:hypothetical protein ILYODFUR_029529 [Ilyodon furcidens]|uniref:Secreted protein n=1 Tax=Ilyodon furcidens TaxID=33524 RepID=A0ABV0UN49_9TELE
MCIWHMCSLYLGSFWHQLRLRCCCGCCTQVVKSTSGEHRGFQQLHVTVVPFLGGNATFLSTSQRLLHHHLCITQPVVKQLFFFCEPDIVTDWLHQPVLQSISSIPRDLKPYVTCTNPPVFCRKKVSLADQLP